MYKTACKAIHTIWCNGKEVHDRGCLHGVELKFVLVVVFIAERKQYTTQPRNRPHLKLIGKVID